MNDLSKYELYDYQRKGVEFALKNPYCLIADEMGLGKTRQALAVASMTSSCVLIVVPASLVASWIAEIEKFCPSLRYTIVSYSMLHKMVGIYEHDMIVADESHYLKTPDSRRTKAFLSLVKKGEPKRCILLSGTPIKNRVPELYMPLCILTRGKLEKLISYHDFARRFSFEETFYVNNMEVSKFTGVRNQKELVAILKPYMIRRLAENVLSLPEQNDIIVPTKGKKIPHYDEVVNRFFLDSKKTPEFTTTKRIMSESKYEFTAKYAKEILNTQDQIIIFSDHRNTVKLISDKLNKLKISAKYISSDVPVIERDIALSSFTNGHTKVLCATIGVGSVGLNLQNCNTVVYNDFPFVPADLDQSKARIHRIGQTKKCFYHYIISNEIDSKVLGVLNKKMKTIREVIDG